MKMKCANKKKGGGGNDHRVKLIEEILLRIFVLFVVVVSICDARERSVILKDSYLRYSE